MYYVIYAIGRLIWDVFRDVLDPLSTRILKLFARLGAVFIASMAVYVVVRHLLGSY